MPPTPRNFLDLLDQQIDRALGCIPETRRGQTVRRWVTPSLAARFETEQAYQDFLDDIEETVDDFLLSAPSAGGSTAFDRAAKGFRGPVQEARALAALRDARFHLFRIDAAVRDGILGCANIQTGEAFRLFWPFATAPDPGLVFFGRLAEDNTGLFFPAGAITPMDDAAREVASGPACPARFSRDKESRWVEAVYMHVVRNGTAAFPGLTAPQDAEPAEGMLTDMDHRLLPILLAWGDLGDAEADQDLIEATRSLADIQCTLCAVLGVHETHDEPEMHRAFERIALLLLKTIRDQEIASGPAGEITLTLDAIGRAIASYAEGAGNLAGLDETFAELRRRLAGAEE